MKPRFLPTLCVHSNFFISSFCFEYIFGVLSHDFIIFNRHFKSIPDVFSPGVGKGRRDLIFESLVVSDAQKMEKKQLMSSLELLFAFLPFLLLFERVEWRKLTRA